MNTKITPEIETSFPQKKEPSDAKDANDSKVNLLESESPQEKIEPANAHQPEMSDAQTAEKQAPAKHVPESQPLHQRYELQNNPITVTSSAFIRNDESEIGKEVKRTGIDFLKPPRCIQLMQNPELKGELIMLSLVDERTIRVMQEKKQCSEESKSHDSTLIDCKKEVSIISFWRINKYYRPMCYRQLSIPDPWTFTKYNE